MRRVLTILLGLFAAGTLAWAWVATSRANPVAGVLETLGQFGAMLLPLGTHLGFSKGIEHPGPGRFGILLCGLLFWTAILSPALGGMICSPTGPAIEQYAMMALVFPFLLIVKAVTWTPPPFTPREPGRSVVWAK